MPELPAWVQSKSSLEGLEGGPSKEISQLIRSLKEKGVRVERTKSSHFKAYTPGGLYFFAGTPSDYRALKNIIADLRKRGVNL